jgi:PAS domain S-box-containing protein
MNTGAMQAEQPSPAPLLRALILEENAHEATRIVSAVEGGGYKVQCAVLNSPTAFREHLSAGQFDIILADFNLGNWTALDALEILGLLGKSIPLIVVAASRGEDAAAECVKRGAADYVLKERPARLPMAIRQALEMKRMRDERNAAEERFREVVEGTDAIVWEADTATGSVTFVSAGAEKILGYTTDQWLRTPDFWADHIHLADREEALACEREVIEKGKPRSVEYRMRKADGRDRWFRVAMHAVATAEGKVERLRGIMVDISVVKRAERELSESQALANAIVDSTSDLIWSVDPEDFTLLRFNRSLRSYFFHRRGMSIKIGMRPEDLSFSQDCAEQWHKLYGRALSEGSFTTDYVAQSSAPTLQLTLNLLKRDGKVFGISVFGKDITEQKHAEEQLRHSQEELQSVLAAIPDYLWSADIDDQGKVTYRYYSPVVEKLTGRPPEFFMPGPERWLSTIHPDDLPKIQKVVASITTGQAPRLTEEYRIIHADGSVRWVRDSVQVRRVNGNFRVDGVVSDVTDRRQAEEALRESEERYRRLFEVESDAILVLDAVKWRYLDVNAAASELYGYTHDEFLGLSPEQISAEPEKTRAAIAHEWTHVQLRWHHKKDGTVFPVEITGNRFLDRKHNIHVAAIRDITRRQRAEEELRKSEARWRAVFENSSVGIALTDCVTTQFQAANLAFQKMLGYTEGELRSLTFMEITHDDDREPNRRLLNEVVDGKRQSFAMEKRYRRKDHSLIWVNLHVSLVPGTERIPRFSLAIVEDITERKKAEEDLRESEARYRTFIDHSSEGVWRVELEQPIPLNLPAMEILERLMQSGYLAECNLAHARNFGFSTVSEMVGKRMCDLIPAADEGRLESFRAEARGGWRDRSTEFRTRDKTGNPRHFVRTEIPIIENGMLVRVWGITRDLTEIKRAGEERRRSLGELRALAARLQHIREEERKRVAREIHDQLGQALTAIKIDLSSLIHDLPAAEKQAGNRTDSILKLVDESIHTVRRISTELRPGILDDMGLVAALEWAGEDFQARTGTMCRLDLPRYHLAVNPEQATAIFRIFQETLTNVARHAGASAVDVRLSNEGPDLVLKVHDNGIGITEQKHTNGESLGILGMRERALLLRGELNIRGNPEDGTTVRVRIPYSCPTS